jgi:hypothetical protein
MLQNCNFFYNLLMLFMLVLLMELYHSSLKVEHGRVIRYTLSLPSHHYKAKHLHY